MHNVRYLHRRKPGPGSSALGDEELLPILDDEADLHVLDAPAHDVHDPSSDAPDLDPETAPVTTARMPLRVDGIDLGSLTLFAIRCALIAVISAAIGVGLLWLGLSSAGLVDRTESFMQSIGFRGFEISTTDVIVGLVLISAAAALTLASLVVVAGAAYNLLAARGRGLTLRVSAPVAGVVADTAPAAHPVEEVPEDRAGGPVRRAAEPRAAAGGAVASPVMPRVPAGAAATATPAGPIA